MDGNVLPSKLLSRLSNAAGLIRSHNFIQVYSHYDADGLSSAGIIANVLLRENKEFRVRTFTSLDEEAMQEIRECKYDCILLTDLGASYIPELEALGKDVIVLDHHTIQSDSRIQHQDALEDRQGQFRKHWCRTQQRRYEGGRSR